MRILIPSLPPVRSTTFCVTFRCDWAHLTWNSSLIALLTLAIWATNDNSAKAIVGYPDVVLEFYNSGEGPYTESYGGSYPEGLGWPVPVPVEVITGNEPGVTGFNDFLSLPIDSFVVLGFLDERIVDGPGNDIQIMVPWGPSESAEVFVRGSRGQFEFLGVATQPDSANCEDPPNMCPAEGVLDLSMIDFAESVDAIKIVSQSTLGSSPGFDVFHVVVPPGSIYLSGDFDSNGELDADDIDLLVMAIRDGLSPAPYDLNGDENVNDLDRDVWVHDRANTFFGDANLDGEFNSGDLVLVFEAGQYEDNVVGNSGWATGDWNGDAEFTTSDLVLAFQDGGHEQGPRGAVAAVPEPSTVLTLMVAVFLMSFHFRAEKGTAVR